MAKQYSNDESGVTEMMEDIFGDEITLFTSNDSDVEDVPNITVKRKVWLPHHKYYNVDLTTQLRVLPMKINNIFSSEFKDVFHNIYTFNNIDYKYVLISGKVHGISHSITEKVTLTVDDGTGIMSCVVDQYPNELKLRLELKNNVEDTQTKKRMNKKEFFKYTQMNDEEFNKIDGETEDLFLITARNLFMKKIDQELEIKHPLKNNIKLGDKVTVTGRVKDYQERIIFAWSIKREVDKDTFLLLGHEYNLKYK